LNSAILGFPRRDVEKRFDRIVEFAGLQEFIDAPVRTYSTGMGARLGFSVATDVQPEILIVDEILGVGDANFQKKSFERIQQFQADGSTILLVTHSLQKVREMCTRVIWLEEGNLVMEGDAEQVVSQYMERNKQQEEARLKKKRQAQQKREAPKRWGNRKAEIVDVRIENTANEEQHIFQTGDELRLRIRYHAHEPIDDAVFGMAIHNNKGIHITGPNTQVAGLDVPALQGEGEILFRVPALPLLDGLYHISVAIVNEQDTDIYDYHNRLYDFRIDNAGNPSAEKYGLVTLGGEWEFLG
ncbi:MAG: ABC transporter ATP-binding protein, partial [Anaerolineae bacterium]